MNHHKYKRMYTPVPITNREWCDKVIEKAPIGVMLNSMTETKPCNRPRQMKRSLSSLNNL